MRRPTVPQLALALTLLAPFTTAPAWAQESEPPKKPEAADPLDRVPDLKLYRDASIRLHEGDHAGAVRLLDRLLATHPESRWAVEARFWRASALEELGRRDEALAAYRALRKLHPKSGWSEDAARRVERLLSKTARTAIKCKVALAEGAPFQGSLHALDGAGALLSGGPFATPKRVAFAKIARIELDGDAGAQLLVLQNGDRVSGRVLRAEPQAIVVEVPGIEAPLVLPPARLRELRVPGRADVAFVGTHVGGVTPSFSHRLHAAGKLADVQLERTTTVNPDGSRTTTTVDPAGRKTITTVRRQGKGRHVRIVRGEGDEAAAIELQLEGGVVGEALLGDLTQELPDDIADQIQGVDLDLDLEIDDKELDALEEALRELPADLRERIRESLRSKRSRRARRVWVERGEDGKERVLILEGDEAKKPARRQRKVLFREEGGKEHVLILEGDEGHQGHQKKIEKKVIVVEGDGPHPGHGPIKKKVIVVEGGGHGGHVVIPRKGEKKVIVVEGDGPHSGHGPIKKKVVVVDGDRIVDGVLGRASEEEHVFVGPDGKKRVVRTRVRGGHDFSFTPGAQGEHDFAFTPGVHGGHDYALATTPEGNHVYSWVSATQPTQDRVFLRNGDILSGSIKSLDGSTLELETDYGKVTIRRNQIRQVAFATPPQPYLGISMRDVPGGVAVDAVHPKSAAEVAGLQAGDVIRHVGASREPLTTARLRAEIEKRSVGDTVRLHIQRGEGNTVISAKLLERPKTIAFKAAGAPELHRAKAIEELLKAERAQKHAGELRGKADELRGKADELRAKAEELRLLERGKAEAQKQLHRLLERGTKENLDRLLKDPSPLERLLKQPGVLERLQKDPQLLERLLNEPGALERLGEPKREKLHKHLLEQKQAQGQAQGDGRPRLGVALSTGEGGVTIEKVLPGSLAAKLGLKAGDQIRRIGSTQIASLEDVARAMKGLKSGDELVLETYRIEGETHAAREFRVRLP